MGEELRRQMTDGLADGGEGNDFISQKKEWKTRESKSCGKNAMQLAAGAAG